MTQNTVREITLHIVFVLSARGLQMVRNYNQWYWDSSGTDWLWHTPCCYAGNTERVTI